MLSTQTGTISDRDAIRGRGGFYPDNVFSLSNFYGPSNIKTIFKWCRELVLSDAAISGAIHKLAEAPITDLIVEHDEAVIQKRWEELLSKKLKVRERMFDAGMDLVAYSNAFLSLEKPVERYLVSPSVHPDIRSDARLVTAGKMNPTDFDLKYRDALGAGAFGTGKTYRIERLEWTFNGKEFRGPCPISGKTVIFEVADRYHASADTMYIKRWDPNRITIIPNEFTDKNIYRYTMKHATRELIKKGNRELLSTVPWQFIQAALDSRDVQFTDNSRLLHLTNARISGLYDGWAVPRLYSAFKYIFYYLTLLRSNEATARGRINDLPIIFPQSQTGTFDPASISSGGQFTGKLQAMLAQWRKNPAYVGIAPFPVGVTTLFGQGRMNLISSELDPIIRLICVALGLPYDLLFGGGGFSGMAVTQRLFTAQTGLHRERFNDALEFFVERAASELGHDRYPRTVSVRLKEIEGPDDIQKKQARMQMAQAGMFPLKPVLEDLGLDPDKAFDQLIEEQGKLNKLQTLKAKGQAFAQVEGQDIMARAQAKLQGAEAPVDPNADPAAQGVPQEASAAVGAQRADAKMLGEPDPYGPDALAPGGAGGQIPAEEPDPTDQLDPETKHQVEILVKYVGEHPDMRDEIMRLAKTKYPKAHAHIMSELARLDGQTGQVPDAELPGAADAGSEFQYAAEGAGSVGAPPAPAGGGLVNSGPGGQATSGAGGKSMMPGVSDGQPEQLPPRRATGGV